MKNTKWARILVLPHLFLLSALMLFPSYSVSTAQSKPTAQRLEGTVWKASTAIPLEGKTLIIRLVFRFLEKGKVRIGSSLKLYGSYNLRDGVRDIDRPGDEIPGFSTIKAYGLIKTDSAEEVGTYRLKGDSIHLESDSLSIDATIAGSSISGEITFNSYKEKTELVLQRSSGEINSAPDSREENSSKPDVAITIKGINIDAVFLHVEADTLRKNKQYREAIEKYTQVIGLSPSDMLAYLYRGDCKLELQDNRGAIADYDRALKIFEPFLQRVIDEPFLARLVSHAYDSRGVAKNRLGDKAGACIDFRKSCSFRRNEACEKIKQVCN